MKSIIYFLALVLAVAEGLPSSTTERATTPSMDLMGASGSTEAQQNSLNSIRIFRKGFTTYETRIKSFINAMRMAYLTMSDDAKFLDELRKYEEQLPETTRLVSRRYRERCFCEGTEWSPCPERCMDSCQYDTMHSNARFDADNCTDISTDGGIDNCWCYSGSTTRCNRGRLENCYEWRTEEKPTTELCTEFTPNRTLIETSYARFAELLTEPFKKMVRDLDFQLAYLKQSATATDMLNDLATEICDDQDGTLCLPEVKQILSKKLTSVKQLQRNLTLKMIETQENAEKASVNLNNLREETFTHMTQAIKNYTCCLKGLSFAVIDNECNTTAGKSVKVLTTTVETPFEETTEETVPVIQNALPPCGELHACDNGMCIKPLWLCDGEDDCGDGSDEANC